MMSVRKSQRVLTDALWTLVDMLCELSIFERTTTFTYVTPAPFITPLSDNIPNLSLLPLLLRVRDGHQTPIILFRYLRYQRVSRNIHDDKRRTRTDLDPMPCRRTHVRAVALSPAIVLQ